MTAVTKTDEQKIEEVIQRLDGFHCDYGCEEDECLHVQCEDCGTTAHTCAGCSNDYCDCTEADWAEGANGLTYCCQACADAYGAEEA
jgi:hypothetical protein